MHRNIYIATSVLVLHGVVLWALQAGLLYQWAPVVAPAEVLIQVSLASDAPATVVPAPPKFEQKSPTALVKPTQEATKTIAKAPPVERTETPLATQRPAAAAPVVAATPPPAAPPANAAASTNTNTSNPANATPVAATAPRAPAVELPSSDADYLRNPKPPYPPLSKRLGEQGKVVVRTLIGADGSAQQAEIKESSGYDRLDQAALATALSWRYVPGKRAGVPQAMWFNVPFQFVLE